MAGSLQRFGYLLDSNIAPPTGSPGFFIRSDESNQRALGIPPGAIQPGPLPAVIAKVYPRYIYWEGLNANGEIIRRRIPVTSPDNQYYRLGGQLDLEVYPGTTIRGWITGSVGEKKQFVRGTNAPFDTGITDGTQP